MFSPIKLAFCNSACPNLDHPYSSLIISFFSSRSTWRSCARRTSSTRCRRSPPPTRPSPCSSSPRSTGGKNYQFMHWRLPVNLQKGWFVLEATSNLSKKPLNKLIHTKRCFQETSRYILSFFTFALTRTCLFLNCLSDPKKTTKQGRCWIKIFPHFCGDNNFNSGANPPARLS